MRLELQFHIQKMCINKPKINIPKLLIDILTTLQDSGYKPYLVGGCVRDFLLNKPVKDFADSRKFAKGQFSMDFRVSIICKGFVEKFINFINKNKKGLFVVRMIAEKELKI